MAQDAVDEENSILTGAFSGAATGAAASGGNPFAIAGGAIIGGFIAGKSAGDQNRAARRAEQARVEALHKASIFKSAAQRQTQSLRQTGRNLGPSKPAGSTTSNVIPTGSTPTSAIGSGISSSGTF